MPTYKIVRHYLNTGDHIKRSRTVRGKTGLTVHQVRTHCKDPETASDTCTNAKGKKRTEKYGPWFDSFEQEK